MTKQVFTQAGPGEPRAQEAARSFDDGIGPIRLPGWTGRRNALSPHWIAKHGALVVAKSCAGFDRAAVEALTQLTRSIAEAGGDGGLRYLVIDFAHQDARGGAAPAGFESLVAAVAELIFEAPVITVAWARGFMAGPDLDLAMHCAILTAQQTARFSFDGDPAALFGLYAALARKIGFVKTERLIENGDALDAEDMRQLCLVKEVVAASDGLAAIEDCLGRYGRRHNAARAIFRAQRLAEAPIGHAGAEASGRN